MHKFGSYCAWSRAASPISRPRTPGFDSTQPTLNHDGRTLAGTVNGRSRQGSQARHTRTAVRRAHFDRPVVGVGDGANDLPMLQAAAWARLPGCPRSRPRSRAHDHGDLTALLHLRAIAARLRRKDRPMTDAVQIVLASGRRATTADASARSPSPCPARRRPGADPPASCRSIPTCARADDTLTRRPRARQAADRRLGQRGGDRGTSLRQGRNR
jgi:hypothetical protein